MTESSNDLSTRSGARTGRDLGPLASSAWIVVLLAAIVGWSWLIRTEPNRPRPGSPSTSTPSTVPAATALRTDPDAHPGTERPSSTLSHPDASPTGTPGVASLADRALRDAARLTTAGVWTRQIGLYCNAATVERLMAGAGRGPTSPLYVLPVTHDGRACFRLCWGAFPDRGAADRAEPPAGLLAGNRPHTRPVSEVLP